MKTTSNFNKRTANSAGSELRQKRINCRSIGKCKYPISDHNSPWSETKQRVLIDIYARWSSILTEMPASGELKSGDPLFFTTLPTPDKYGNDWGHYNEVFHDIQTIEIRDHRFDARNNLCQWLNRCKNVPETVLRIRKIQVLS